MQEEPASRDRQPSQKPLTFWPSETSSFVARDDQSPRDSKAQALFKLFVDKMLQLSLNTDSED